jgi:hypothetical protein
MHIFIINQNVLPGTLTHQLHDLNSNCCLLPERIDQILLGPFDSYYEAVSDARLKYPEWSIEGCPHCCKKHHRHSQLKPTF